MKEDGQQAFKLIKMAATAGYSQAKRSFGVCYEIGKGVAADRSEAIRWYQAAADQGNTQAIEDLARLRCCGCTML